ncbi:lipase 3-like [Contarinia nasturtii]|uniref:lipase 3-like n=1 Tax=Contarinia nasturtii TaxID=265458 RepID=UPI0012D4BC9E|nr:lipase 3-like [Contarinia nasturtii]
MKIRAIFVLFVQYFPFSKMDGMIQRVQKAGVEIERHNVTTEDGYILGLYHLVPPKIETFKNKTMFLMHGLAACSRDYVIYPNISMAYYFAQRGFDVWLGNARGSTFSRKHITLDPDQSEFWMFSWHEIGVYDLPAMIDFVLNQTKEHQLTYVGHSQGGTAVTVLLCERPEYNKKFRSVHLLAGAVIMKHSSSLRSLMFPSGNVMNALLAIVEKLDLVEWFSYADFSKLSKLMAKFCSSSNIDEMCKFYLEFVMGESAPGSYYDVSKSNCDLMRYHYIRLLLKLYWSKYISERFQKYDFGHSKNVALYGMSKPPEYNLKNIKTKLHIVYGTNDKLVVSEAIPVLRNELKRSVVAVDKMEHFNHIDFLYGKLTHLTPPLILRVMNTI